MNAGEIIRQIEKRFIRTDLPNIRVGDIVKMRIRVAEADKVRLHPFEGSVIRRTGRGARASFTVRKISFGEGIERTFPLHSPVIESMQVVSQGKVKRAKLYYLRGRVGKGTRIEQSQAQAGATVA